MTDYERTIAKHIEEEKEQDEKYFERMNRINEYKNNNGSLEGIEEEILSLINDLTYSEEYSPYGRQYIPCAYEKYGEYLSLVGRHHDSFKAYQCALDGYQNSFRNWSGIRIHISKRLYTNLMNEATKSGHYTEAFYYYDALKQTINKQINRLKTPPSPIYEVREIQDIDRHVDLPKRKIEISNVDYLFQKIIEEQYSNEMRDKNLSEREKHNLQYLRESLNLKKSNFELDFSLKQK